MSESAHIARPYARAVFALAKADKSAGALDEWRGRLDALAVIAADAEVVAATNNPRISDEELQALMLSVVAAVGSAESRKAIMHARKKSRPSGTLGLAPTPPDVDTADELENLIKLLVHNRRLDAAPSIARIYAELCAEETRTLEAQMITAAPLNDAQQKQFTAALKTKLDRDVKLEFAVDENLVGGAVVRAGDWVIDGSVRAQLEQLVGALRA